MMIVMIRKRLATAGYPLWLCWISWTSINIINQHLVQNAIMLIVRIRHNKYKKNDKFKKIIRKWYQVRSASGNRRLSTVLLSARSAHSWQRLHHQHYGYLQHFHRHHHSHYQHHRQKTSTQINFAILWKRWGVSKVWALVTKVSFFQFSRALHCASSILWLQ